MLYWLIPYLVVYNANDTGNWRYGPEHLFKAEIRGNMVNGDSSMRSDVDMFISCRPLNSSSILCQVDSATLDSYDIFPESDGNLTKEETHRQFVELSDATFQVEFDKMGPRYVTFLNNTKGPFRENMIRALANQFNIGTDLSQMKPEKENIFEERSVDSICETSFDIRKTKLPFEEEEPAAIVGFNFDVPLFTDRLENESIIIEKSRKMNACSVKPNYFFVGSSEKDLGDWKYDMRIENNIIRSKSIIYLGKNGFSSYNENVGTIVVEHAGMASKVYSPKKMGEFKFSETIRFKLVAIQPATKKL